MATVNILIADDMESIHQDLRNTLDSISFDYKVVKDFYNTSSLKRYLRSLFKSENDEGVDVLILDHDFGGSGANGLEALPEIRKIAPNLPIIFLTTYEDNQFIEASELYNVDYIHKPVKAFDLRFRIKDVIRCSVQWESFKEKLLENEDMITYLLEQNEKFEQEINADVEKSFPVSIEQLIQNIFPEIECKVAAFRLLIKQNVKQAVWNRMFRTLKLIDWKKEDSAPSGVKIQKFNSAIKCGLKNVWEYRFSQAGRIFVQRRENAKPLLLLIDPTHSYSDRLVF